MTQIVDVQKNIFEIPEHLPNVLINKWIIPDIDIDNLIKILKIDEIGIPYVKELLNNPTSLPINLLKQRELLNDIHQDYIDTINMESFSDKVRNKLNSHTTNLLWFLNPHSDETIEYYDTFFLFDIKIPKPFRTYRTIFKLVEYFVTRYNLL